MQKSLINVYFKFTFIVIFSYQVILSYLSYLFLMIFLSTNVPWPTHDVSIGAVGDDFWLSIAHHFCDIFKSTISTMCSVILILWYRNVIWYSHWFWFCLSKQRNLQGPFSFEKVWTFNAMASIVDSTVIHPFFMSTDKHMLWTT